MQWFIFSVWIKQFSCFIWGKSNGSSRNGGINPHIQTAQSLQLPGSGFVWAQNMPCRTPKGSLTLPCTGSCREKTVSVKMPWQYPFFQSDSLMHKQKTSKFSIKPKTFQVSLSKYLRHKDLADCCVSGSPMPIHFLCHVQGLVLFHGVKISRKPPCRYHGMRIRTWADPGKQLATVPYQGDVNRRDGNTGLCGCSFSLVGCDGDSQSCSALTTTMVFWITWDLHFWISVVGNLGGKSHKGEMSLSKYLKEDN